MSADQEGRPDMPRTPAPPVAAPPASPPGAAPSMTEAPAVGRGTTMALEDAHEVLARIGDRAGAVDRGEADPVEDLRGLADALNLFDPTRTPLSRAVAIVEAVAAQSLAVGFVAWAQRMTAEYLALAPRSPAAAERLADVVAVRRRGVTAMAAAQRQAVGLERAPVTAKPGPDDTLTVDGTVAWASNVAPDSIVVLGANLADGASRVLAVDADRLSFRPAPDLLGMNATASGALVLDAVPLPADAVVSSDLPAFVAGIRPRFLLLQSAFCAGVTGAALAESAPAITGVAEVYAAEHADLGARHAAARERLHRAAAAETAAPGAVPVRDLIELRLDTMSLGTATTRLGLNVAGGRGYATGSAANRRFREASFLPVQSPSEAQLRWELARALEARP